MTALIIICTEETPTPVPALLAIKIEEGGVLTFLMKWEEVYSGGILGETEGNRKYMKTGREAGEVGEVEEEEEERH